MAGEAAAPDLALFRVLAARKPVESEVQGTSMGAALPHGTRIRISPLAEGTRPLPGQVIAFAAGGRIMVHRVASLGRWRAARGHLITQGDGNWLCDPPIALEAIAGHVHEAELDGAWKPVPVSAAPAGRRLLGALSLAAVGVALEASPVFAARLARVMSYGRMTARLAWSKVARAPAGRAGG
jgi:hypothetical protein